MRIFFLVLFSCFFISYFANAQSARLIQSELELENKITNHLNQVLSTRLSEGSFTVSAKVKLAEIQVQKPKPAVPASNLQSVLQNQLGTLDTEKLIRSYEEDIENMKQTTSLQFEDRLNISQISILVGISSEFSDTYVSEIETWLKKYTQQLYGPKTQASITKITDKPGSENAKNGLSKKGLEEHLKDFQQLYGWIILGLCLIIAAALLRARAGGADPTAKPSSPTNNLALENQNNKVDQKNLSSQVTSFQEMDFISKTMEHLSGKIFLASIEMPQHIVAFIRYQLANETEGDLKVACLIDALYATRERMLAAPALPAQDQPTFPFIDLKLEGAFNGYESNLKEKLKILSEMGYEKRINLYESIYWDLIAFRSLGSQQYSLRFDDMRGLSEKDQTKVLKSIQSPDRLITFLLMRAEDRKNVFKNYDENSRIEFFKLLKNIDQIHEKEIKEAERKVQHIINLEIKSTNSQDSFVDLSENANLMIDELKLSDQIRTLVSAYPDFSLLPEFLKSRWTLAYLPQWKPTAITLVHQVCDISELKLLCLLREDFKNLLIETATTRNSIILKDELSSYTQNYDFKDSEEHKLNEISFKIIEMMKTQNYDPQSIVDNQDLQKVTKAS